MSRQDLRQIISEGVIAFSLIAGVYLLFVDPARKEITGARMQLRDDSELRASALYEGQGLATARAALHNALERARAISGSSEAAQDELIAFERLAEVAAATGMDVSNLTRRAIKQPAQGPTPAPAVTMLSPTDPNAAGPYAVPPVQRDALVGFEITVEGTFDNLVTLVDRLANGRDFTSVLSIAILPAGDTSSPRVLATIQTLHYGFDAQPAIRLIESALSHVVLEEAAP